MNEVTLTINAIEQGDPQATEKLFSLVYEELRLLAAQKMGKEKPGQTHQAIAIVHKAYLHGSERSRLAPVPNPRCETSRIYLHG